MSALLSKSLRKTVSKHTIDMVSVTMMKISIVKICSRPSKYYTTLLKIEMKEFTCIVHLV